jgi:hypothetical protein
MPSAIHSMIAALGLAFVLPAPADAAQTDPEVIIYRFPGVLDNGRGVFNSRRGLIVALAARHAIPASTNSASLWRLVA